VIVHTSFNNPNSRLLALDAENGQLLWQAKLNLHGYVSNAIADIDGDGRNEVLLAMRSNTIYCFDGNGRERWHTITGGNAFFWTPAVADINGDGRCEIIAGVRRTNERGNSWFVLDDKGQIQGEYKMPGGANAAPLVADINEDNQLDIILPGSDKGLLRCLTFGGKAQGTRMEWFSHRYDARRKGGLQQLAKRFAGADFSQAELTDSFIETSRDFNALLGRDAARIKIAGRVVRAGRHTLAVWEDPNPWNETAPLLDTAAIAENLSVDVEMYLNESESRALTILNLRPQSIDVQIRRIKGTDWDLQLYEVINVPRKEGRPVGDILADLNTAGQSIWLEVKPARSG